MGPDAGLQGLDAGVGLGLDVPLELVLDIEITQHHYGDDGADGQIADQELPMPIPPGEEVEVAPDPIGALADQHGHRQHQAEAVQGRGEPGPVPHQAAGEAQQRRARQGDPLDEQGGHHPPLPPPLGAGGLAEGQHIGQQLGRDHHRKDPAYIAQIGQVQLVVLAVVACIHWDNGFRLAHGPRAQKGPTPRLSDRQGESFGGAAPGKPGTAGVPCPRVLSLWPPGSRRGLLTGGQYCYTGRFQFSMQCRPQT